jgi:CRISPR/Cas system-associated endonuclease Cas3-HD
MKLLGKRKLAKVVLLRTIKAAFIAGYTAPGRPFYQHEVTAAWIDYKHSKLSYLLEAFLRTSTSSPLTAIM